MGPDICIYHGNCADGFTAAWAAWKAFGDGVRFIPGVYGEPPPDVAGNHVLMVDFTYKRPVIEAMGAVAESITILDHHKTAQADLSGYPPPIEGPYNPAAIEQWRRDCNAPNGIHVLFDMERSGAQITWDYLHPGRPRPVLVNYVGDRDLWQFKLPMSREIAAWVFSYNYNFRNWDFLSSSLRTMADVARVGDEGAAIERKHFKDIAELLAQTRRPMVIGGHRIEVANLPYTMSSDAAGMLAEGQAFGACYFDRNDGQRVFSLRSRDGGVDVSTIAKAYGGGGHAQAAGFQMPMGWEGDTESARITVAVPA